MKVTATGMQLTKCIFFPLLFSFFLFFFISSFLLIFFSFFFPSEKTKKLISHGNYKRIWPFRTCPWLFLFSPFTLLYTYTVITWRDHLLSTSSAILPSFLLSLLLRCWPVYRELRTTINNCSAMRVELETLFLIVRSDLFLFAKFFFHEFSIKYI